MSLKRQERFRPWRSDIFTASHRSICTYVVHSHPCDHDICISIYGTRRRR